MILLSKTYETWDENALDCGETDDRGFLWENSPHGIRETVRRIEGGEPSQSPITNPASVWFSFSDTDFRTGEETTESVHYSHGNNAHSLKYWIMALRAAGFEVKA